MFDTVTVELDGDTIVLTPSVGAMEFLANKYGPLQKILDGIATLDYNLYTDIIIAGVLPRKADVKSTKEAVFKHGIIELMPILTEYALLLMNGGKKPKEGDTDENPPTAS